MQAEEAIQRIHTVAAKLGRKRKDTDDLIKRTEDLAALLRKLENEHSREAVRIERNITQRFNVAQRALAEDRMARERELAAAERQRQRGEAPLPARISAVISAMTMLEEGTRAASFDGPRIHSASDRPSGLPAAEVSMVEEWLSVFVRMAEAAELALDQALGLSPTSQGRRDVDRDARLLSYEGKTPIFVAFIEGVSESHVRKLRVRSGRRASDGRRKVRLQEAA